MTCFRFLFPLPPGITRKSRVVDLRSNPVCSYNVVNVQEGEDFALLILGYGSFFIFFIIVSLQQNPSKSQVFFHKPAVALAGLGL